MQPIYYEPVLRTDSLTYIFDNSAQIQAREDSVRNQELYSFKREDNLSFYEDIYLAESTRQKTHTEHETKHPGEYKLFTLEQDDGVFALLLISFLCITRIYKHGTSFFTENARLLFSSRKDLSLFTQTTINEFWFNFILIFQSVLLSAIILFNYILHLQKNSYPQHSFYTIVLFILVIATFLGIKYAIYKLVGYVFNIKDQMIVWLRSYMITIEMLGIIAFIPVLLLIYSQLYYSFVIIFLISLFVISRILIFYRIIVFFIRSNINIFFLIAYLCAQEIIPYIFLYHILIFLYKIDLTSLLWH